MSTQKSLCPHDSLCTSYTACSDIWKVHSQGSQNLDLPALAKGRWKITDAVNVTTYRPLEFYSPPEGPPGYWSEEDELCELYIRLKEMELLKLVGEKFETTRYHFLSSIHDEKMQKLRNKSSPSKT